MPKLFKVIFQGIYQGVQSLSVGDMGDSRKSGYPIPPFYFICIGADL
jgi:hypothetical protein